MKHKRTDRVFLYISLSGFLVTSASFLLMPVEAVNIVPGLMFWVGLIIGSSFQVILAIRRRVSLKIEGSGRKEKRPPRCGLFSFESNREATIVDNILVVSFVAAVLAFIITKGFGFVCYPFIATTVFSFCLHCILNGRIYFHLKEHKLRPEPERPSEFSINKGESENENS